ncbi:uncharacterized protein CELE_C10G11.1 [Caenorhabditis elegans]|uniref:Uncharacterized protein n=2 Tax=Caenorhabditis elegans TaxID=6239 RepID=E5QCF4_CAEEL|nr:Uncharacterized protein CELE_C10G11.1 [Caenorhabditis elegans]CCD64190.1 Uncharacterized protein CELE_C10G11.1 [Caenorhabditis elegans]|eukprot:NP_001250167.1 Uncharacterized protein CELE_C10G11.1 [Caenorhabditis elegans]
MVVFGLEILTLICHLIPILLVPLILIFCSSKKKEPHRPSVSPTNTNVGTTQSSSPALTPIQRTPTKPDSDDDDVKFNITVKAPVEKKDEFEGDDEENPLAKLALKTKPKKPVDAAIPAPLKTPAKAPRTRTKESAIAPERVFLAPNEKQIGVSRYQFEASQPPTTNNNALTKKQSVDMKMPKSTDLPAVPTRAMTPGPKPSCDPPNNNKSAMKMKVMQEPTCKELAVDKTQ